MSDEDPSRDDLAGDEGTGRPAAPETPGGTASSPPVRDDEAADPADASSPGDPRPADAPGAPEPAGDATAAEEDENEGEGDGSSSPETGASGQDGDGAEAGAPVEPADGDALSGGDTAGPRRRRKALRWAAVGAVALLLAGGGGAAWLYHDLVGGIEQQHVSDRLGANRPRKLNKSLNILLIGSDTREGENAEYAVPGMAGARSDTTMLLHLSPNRDQAVGISFPRDSMVKMPACEKEKGGTVPAQFGMLNAAFAYAGPTCTWKTLESLTGIHIDHFVQVDFAGFKRMVDTLGGVEICVDRPVRDPRAELYLKAGKQTVKGDEALGYVRARYSLGDGSDLERIERQQKFMAAVVDKATSGSVLSDPAKTYKFLKAATKSMTTDDDLDLAAMRKLADGLKGMSAGQVRFVTVPVEGYAPDPNRVQWNDELAEPLFDAIRRDDRLPAAPAEPGPARPAPPPPGKVHVTVVDAGARDAKVRRVVNQLRQRGFAVEKKVEKAAAAPESRLVYAPAAEAQASALARDVPDARLTSDPAGPADGVRLVIGADGVRLAPPALNKIRGGVEAGRKVCD